MSTTLSRQEKLLFIAVFVALLTHLVWTVRQSHVEPLVSRQFESSVGQQIPSRNVDNPQASSEAFSVLFGVAPQAVQTESDEPKLPDTFVDMQPRLLAIDQVENKLTARLWLNNIEGSRLLSATLGDVVHGYTLTQLTQSVAVFSHNAAPDEQTLPEFTLQLFKQQAE